MDELNDVLKRAHKVEKDHKVGTRILAVHMVRVLNMDAQTVADNLMQSPNWVRTWIQRYDQQGLDGLRDLPRSGRPPKVQPDLLLDIVTAATTDENGRQRGVTPAGLGQIIRAKTGVKYHVLHVRRIMHRFNLTPKKPELIHVNRAAPGTIRSWQRRIKDRISRLKEDGFTVFEQDEAFFIHDTKSGRKYWSRSGKPLHLSYTGGHSCIAVYGAIANRNDGRRGCKQFFRLYKKFNSKIFVRYLKEMHRTHGKIALIVDRASAHRSKYVKKFLQRNRKIKLIYLPKGTPQLNAAEECWHQSKNALLVSEYYPKLSDLINTISAYFRTIRFKLDIEKFIYRRSLASS